MSDRPQRIQLRRTKGWRIPPNTVVVSRPSKWGNPYVMSDYPAGMSTRLKRELAVRHYRQLLNGALDMPARTLPFTVEDVRRELRSKNLACWCPIGSCCHADILLEIANTKEET